MAVAWAVPAGVLNTPHNLTGLRPSPAGASDDSSAVCAFCHTPQGQDQSQPLWQSQGGASASGFETYDSFGRSGLSDVGRTGSVSVACMSCHDGAQALNVSLSTGPLEAPARPGAEAASMLAPPPGAPRIDRSISHPVGIPYGAFQQVVGEGPVGGPGGVPDAVAQRARGFRSPDSAVIDGVTVWWLETGASGRQRDDIHLYSRTVGADKNAPFVECASCHDPHAESPNFLRRGNSRDPDGLCGSCHAI